MKQKKDNFFIRNKEKIKMLLHISYLIILAIILIGSFYISTEFSDETPEEFYFYLTNGVGNSDISVLIIAIKKCFIYLLLSSLLFVGLMYNILFKLELCFISKKETKSSKNIIIKDKKKYKVYTIYPFRLLKNHKKITTLVLTIIISVCAFFNLKIYDYIKNYNSSSTFIEENINFASKNKVEFNNKRNLITIFMESMETTFLTKEQGGDWDYEVIPELYNILTEDNTVAFASNDTYAGMKNMTNTGWTTASIVSNTSGYPFSIPIDGNEYTSENFMNGAYTLGDLLYDNGYYNEVISSSSLSFGGLKQYFTRHGSYNIIDPGTVSNFNFEINNKTQGPWGLNDKGLLELSKQRLLEISKNNQPFNETIITIDCHHMDGFKSYYTVDKYKTQYENVYATESMIVSEFVSWIKEQDFYKDTTIVLIGDHPSMQSTFFDNKNKNARNRYFAIINPINKASNTKNRLYSSVDTYPTIVSAIGGVIDNNKFSLGTNLFSDKKTVFEEYGIEYVNEEIKKKSIFFNNKILGSDYYTMLDGLEDKKNE